MAGYRSSKKNEYNWDSFSTKDILLVIAMVSINNVFLIIIYSSRRYVRYRPH